LGPPLTGVGVVRAPQQRAESLDRPLDYGQSGGDAVLHQFLQAAALGELQTTGGCPGVGPLLLCGRLRCPGVRLWVTHPVPRPWGTSSGARSRAPTGSTPA